MSGTTLKFRSEVGDVEEVRVALQTIDRAFKTKPYVSATLFDAHTMLYSVADDTPLALTVAEQTIVGRITGGNIDALTDAEVHTIIFGTANPVDQDVLLGAGKKLLANDAAVEIGSAAQPINSYFGNTVTVRGGNELRFSDVGDSHYVGFEAPALTATQIYVLPATDGSATDALITNGSGTLSWGPATPAAHVHDTDTLQLDAVNSDGGAFAFDTTGAVSFNQNIDLVATTATEGQITQGGTRILHTFGTDNIFVGAGSGDLDITGADNTGVGAASLKSLTSGGKNTAVGERAMEAVITGANNTALGFRAGRYHKGSQNVFLGSVAGQGTSGASGSNNIYIGYRSGYVNAGASNSNVAIGVDAGRGGTNYDRCVFLGNFAGRYETADDKFFIDNRTRTDEATSRVESLVYGIFNATVASQEFHVNAKFYALHAATFDGAVTLNSTISAHAHDTETLQIDAINSDAGGGFTFTTAAATTFDQDVYVINNGGNPNLIFGDDFTNYVQVKWVSASNYGYIDSVAAGVGAKLEINVSGGGILLRGLVTMADGIDFAYNTTTGSKHGTATNQKQSWWNAAPVVQPAHIADADGTLADITTKFNTLLAQMATTGLQAAA